VLNLGGGDVDTATPMGSMLLTITPALAQMDDEIKRERVTDSIEKRREAGLGLGGRPRRVTDSQIRTAVRLGTRWRARGAGCPRPGNVPSSLLQAVTSPCRPAGASSTTKIGHIAPH
jgi:DNA invertase Pin-like site-specific DNA recombinase